MKTLYAILFFATLLSAPLYGDDGKITGAKYFKNADVKFKGPGGKVLTRAVGFLKITTDIKTSGGTIGPTISYGRAVGNIPKESYDIPKGLIATPDAEDPLHYCFLHSITFPTSTQGAAVVRWSHAGTSRNVVDCVPIEFP